MPGYVQYLRGKIEVTPIRTRTKETREIIRGESNSPAQLTKRSTVID